MMDHDRQTFVEHNRIGQKPMRNEGREGEKDGAECVCVGGGVMGKPRLRENNRNSIEGECGESPLLLNSLTAVHSAHPPTLPQC